ncbi:nucleotidyltransferase family protein [Knoellia subterranea]|uniref:Nucleotidyltransferase n=1 Tax=Knoellia subterranea KCTC 19937 TaxID=1385521 RepID=A0A0A0JIF6_9MICO|nr:nucleotidyltransferase family protein [Knoellia subterranea]KGN37185.1 nucleotidyltransferase [Knoellia subterranea KCTC 19937]
MSEPSSASVRLRGALVAHAELVGDLLDRYGATNPRLFGSVARGDAGEHSDVDLLVELTPDGGNDLLRVAGLSEELSSLLHTRVDVVTASLLREEVSVTALADAVAV